MAISFPEIVLCIFTSRVRHGNWLTVSAKMNPALPSLLVEKGGIKGLCYDQHGFVL